MSKKVVESVLYTAQELDVILSIIAEEVGPLGYPLPGIPKRMVILGGNLFTFLLHEGFTCTYQPARKQCSQFIKVLLADDYTVQVTLCTGCMWVSVGRSFPVRIDSIGQLIAYLHNLPSQCPSCYYSNGEASLYCGAGADMVKGCSHYTPRDPAPVINNMMEG